MNYQYRKACKCGNVDYITATKAEVAFDLKMEEVAKIACSKCGSKKIYNIDAPKPQIDEELLRIWIRNEDYLFTEQDEELILAQYPENIPLYASYLDSEHVSDYKKGMLIEVLLVMLYERVLNKEEIPTDEVTSKLIHILKQRVDVVSRYGLYGWDYIQKVCYPIIGLDFVGESPRFEDLEPLPAKEKKSDDQEEKRIGLWTQLKRFFR